MNQKIKISQLPAKGANLDPDDLLEIAEFTGTGYISKSITGQEIIDAAAGSGVTDVTGTAPIASTGGTTPDISISQAGSATDGYLSTGDWNAFNNKQDALSSGVNIKTINSTSVLGSGNIAVQPTLVSGTNIKTINSNSLLGSGNVSVQDPITLTTTGTSGAATLVGSTLNIPQYSGGGASGVHALVQPYTGRIIPIVVGGTNMTTVTATANRITAIPFIPAKTFTSSNLFINVSTAVAGTNARILIYSDVNGIPNTKLYESANLDCATTGIKTATTSFTFNAGTTYWICTHTSSNQQLTSYAAAGMLGFYSSGTTMSISYIYSITFGSAPTILTGEGPAITTPPAVLITSA